MAIGGRTCIMSLGVLKTATLFQMAVKPKLTAKQTFFTKLQ